MSVDLRLYALVDPERAGGRRLADLARLVAEGGATLVQLRDKHGTTRASMVEAARAIKAALAPFGVPLLINDRVDVALAAGADGVHVGQDDMAAADARRLLGPRRDHRAVDQDGGAGGGARRSTCSTMSASAASTRRRRRTNEPPIGVDGPAAARRARPRAGAGVPARRHRRHRREQCGRRDDGRRRRRRGDLGAVDGGGPDGGGARPARDRRPRLAARNAL